jgi:Sec7-like guanine-nucleotide exchange factor
MIAQGLKESELDKNKNTKTKDRKVTMDINFSKSGKNYQNLILIENNNAQVIYNSIDDIDKVYFNSQYLKDDAIVDFVKCLCNVSSDEVFSKTQQREFSLHKLIEISYLNMDRIKLVWSKIWSSISEHLIEVSCHENESISMGAINSIRQLAVKFLDKDELTNFHYQREFLKPFLVVFNSNQNIKIRSLVKLFYY